MAAGLPLTAEEFADATETIKRQTKASGNDRLTARFPCYRCPIIEFPLPPHSEFRSAFFRQIYADGVREKAHATLLNVKRNSFRSGNKIEVVSVYNGMNSVGRKPLQEPIPQDSLYLLCVPRFIAYHIYLRKQIVPVSGCRTVSKQDMLFNDATPDIEVDPETYEVTADGQSLKCEPAQTLPLAQKYFFF